ncbi:sugar transferase [Streptomyces sp. DW26H14]|uniref:sugar transferase n=1 Tax=Streptomyces sp. DW26H14 TaxID=3435395 RepID=UPI00403DDD68
MRLDQHPEPPAATTPPRGPAPLRARALSLGKRPPDPKRALDLALGTLLLLAVAPLLATAALVLAVRAPTEAVRALTGRDSGAGATRGARDGAARDSGDGATRGAPPALRGRVFRKEEMVGLHGRPFTLRSLRTRRLRLDLLSRLPEVVRGRMSLVGPAPLPRGHRRTHSAWRSTVRPGLTGLAQVRRASPLPWDEAPLLDQHYVEHCCLAGDLALLAASLRALSPRAGRSAPRTQRGGPARVPRARRRPLLAGLPRAADHARLRAAVAARRGRWGPGTAHGGATRVRAPRTDVSR